MAPPNVVEVEEEKTPYLIRPNPNAAVSSLASGTGVYYSWGNYMAVQRSDDVEV